MARVRLTVDVAPDLRRRIKISAASRDETVKEWIERAILRELREEEGDEYVPPSGPKPEGLREGAPKLRSGATASEAVVEDRR